MTAGSGTFSLERKLERDSERVVLQQVYAEVQGTGWDQRIEKQLE